MPHPEVSEARPQHLAREDVVHLVGDIEDATLTAILATGATYEDIELAVRWAGGAAEEPRPNAHGLSPKAELVYDILMSDPEFSLENERSGS